MGKKRSKISKQKQARAKQSPAKKSSSLGGVKMIKGHSSKFQQSKSASIVVPSAGQQLLQNHLKKLASTPSKNPLLNKTKRKVFLSPPSATSSAAASGSKPHTSLHDEEKEYQRQMASMRERHLASDFKKKELAAAKKNKGAEKSFLEMQPASFSVGKTTHDLLQETVQQMQSMEGVGESQILATPIRTNQSWSVVKEPPAFANNPFEALAENDSDNDEEYNEWNPRMTPIQLAPASFSLLPRITPTPATTPLRFDGEIEAEIDPDL
jgi:hypothetical protein